MKTSSKLVATSYLCPQLMGSQVWSRKPSFTRENGVHWSVLRETPIRPADYLIRAQTIFSIVRLVRSAFLRFFLLHVYKSFACMYIHIHTDCVYLVPEGQKRDQIPWNWGCKGPHTLREQQVLLTTLQSLQPQEIKYFFKDDVIAHSYQKAVLRNDK